jgi:hypothetical protein
MIPNRGFFAETMMTSSAAGELAYDGRELRAAESEDVSSKKPKIRN